MNEKSEEKGFITIAGCANRKYYEKRFHRMVRLCAKTLTKTELYVTDMEVRNWIDWICVLEQIKTNNNTIHNLIG